MRATATFALICILGVTTQARHHGGHRHGNNYMPPHQHQDQDRQAEHTTKPMKNLWHEYWGESSSNGAIAKAAKCWGCSLAMEGASHMLEVSFIHEGILNLAALICEITGAMPGHPLQQCPKLVRQFGEPMYTVVEDYLLTKDRICNEHLGWCTDPVITPIELDSVLDNILATKPVAVQNDDYIQNLYDEMAKSTEPRPTLKALHMSDVHLDFAYTPGTLSNCKDYLCCHVASGYPKHDDDLAAGEWGGIKCDIPVKTYQSMLDHMVENNLPDLLFLTGDFASHEVWDNTADETVGYTVAVTELLQ